MSKPKTARQILVAFNGNQRNPAIQSEITEMFGDTACFVIEDGKIDIEETLDNQTFIRETSQEIDGALTFKDALRELAPQYEADPITGRALLNGATTDRPKIDWSPVSQGLRLVVAYAVESKQLPPGSNSETVVDAILHDPLRAPWNRLAEEWQTLSKSKKPADQTRVIMIRGRLVYNTGDKTVVTKKKVTVDDPELQKLLDMDLPRVPVIAADDPRRQGPTRLDWLVMEMWACRLEPNQYKAVVGWIIWPQPMSGACFHGGTPGQASVLCSMLDTSRHKERIDQLFAALKQLG